MSPKQLVPGSHILGGILLLTRKDEVVQLTEHTPALLSSLSVAEKRFFSLKDSLSSLLGSVEEWYGGAMPKDDISIVAVEITR